MLKVNGGIIIIIFSFLLGVSYQGLNTPPNFFSKKIAKNFEEFWFLVETFCGSK